MGVPYVPVLGLVGTDLLARRDDMVLAPDPFGEGKVTVVARAMRPDVAVFHAHKADLQGNVSFGYAVDAAIVKAKSRVAVSPPSFTATGVPLAVEGLNMTSTQ